MTQLLDTMTARFPQRHPASSRGREAAGSRTVVHPCPAVWQVDASALEVCGYECECGYGCACVRAAAWQARDLALEVRILANEGNLEMS